MGSTGHRKVAATFSTTTRPDHSHHRGDKGAEIVSEKHLGGGECTTPLKDAI